MTEQVKVADTMWLKLKLPSFLTSNQINIVSYFSTSIPNPFKINLTKGVILWHSSESCWTPIVRRARFLNFESPWKQNNILYSTILNKDCGYCMQRQSGKKTVIPYIYWLTRFDSIVLPNNWRKFRGSDNLLVLKLIISFPGLKICMP